MRESAKTAVFAAAALALGVAAAVVQPERANPGIFSDQGQPFYPKFTDPQAARTVEVVDYDEATATATPLKVQFQRGRWVIASHYDYPIDIGDRLVKTAGALIDLKKDIVMSDSAQDHAKFGVVDPLDQKVAGLTGRGKRVTLRDAWGGVLADYILGKPVASKPGYRAVRVPGGKRTYAVKTDADPSARFADWVNAGLLRIASGSIRKVTLNHYKIDEAAGRVIDSEKIELTPDKGEAFRKIAAALDSLKIIDVRPKPPSLADDLRKGQLQLSLETAISLRQKGYFLSPNGRLLAADGDMTVETTHGVIYTLRYGDVASSGDSRYLFVTAAAADPSAERLARELNARFADWYYVISEKTRGQTERSPISSRPAPAAPPASAPRAAPPPPPDDGLPHKPQM